MSIVYKVRPIEEKTQEISSFLTGYWENDIWDISDPFFDNLRPTKWELSSKRVDFSGFTTPIKNEVKYMFAYRLHNQKMRVKTSIVYGTILKHLSTFLHTYYADIASLIDIPYDKALLKWRTYLINKGFNIRNDGRLSSVSYEVIFNQLYSFYQNFYDTRNEYEKDIWDCRKIPGAKITQDGTDYYLNFTDIPDCFCGLVKRYIKFRTTANSQSQCSTDIMALRLFLNFVHKQQPAWKELKLLSRNNIEDYLSWYQKYTEGWKASHIDYMISLRIFLDYIQRAQYPEAPDTPSVLLLFKEDIPKKSHRSENDIKSIPEGVLVQLEDNLEYLTPLEYIPIVILLRATGWRISDILNLRYDTCLNKTSHGWYLCGDIVKTQILNHRVPITDEIAAVVQTVVEESKGRSTPVNNPNHLLFVRFDGKRKGRCPQRGLIQRALNRLSQERKIIDDQNRIFHFGNHAFRHTKGVELINNGMNLLHVQKWMAHVSPEMTLRYAKILDTTMRKSWEKATKQGLFRIDDTGRPKKIELSDTKNEDLIEWEYIRHNLDAVRMPLGYCMKPKKQECYTQLNPCLTCRNLCTTPDFIPQFELEIQEISTLIERGKAQGRTVWVEKNQLILERYEEVLAALKKGKIHHKASKKGREYTEEERNNVR